MNRKILDRGNGYAELVEEFPDLEHFQTVRLGDRERLVVTGESGIYFAWQMNGKIIRVINDARVPPIPDLLVIVGEEKALAGAWHICRVKERYDRNA